MSNFYFDVKTLKRLWNEKEILNFGNFLAEKMRSGHFYKNGWSKSSIEDFDDDYVSIKIECGVDEEGHNEKFYDYLNFDTKEDYFKEYDKHVSIK